MGKARKRRQKKLSLPPVQTTIESLSHEGRGVARIEGKTTFVHAALPDEEVMFKFTRTHRSYDEGMTEEVIKASPMRVEPKCPHFSVCGGCNLQHMDPEEQIKFKQSVLLENLQHIGKVEAEEILEPLTGPYWGYRHKARLGVKNVPKKGRVLVGFREKFSSYIAPMESCVILHPKIGLALMDLSELIEGLTINNKVPQIEVAVGDDATALIFRVLETPSTDDIEKLIEFGKEKEFQIYIQPKGPDTVKLLYPETAELSYKLADHGVDFYFKPNDFTQINVDINKKMINRAIEFLDLDGTEKVLDLFCGLGNFTLPISKKVKEIIGVEGDKTLVERAKINAERNGITNAKFYAADLTQDVTAMPWMQEIPDKVLIDPPRSGAMDVIPQIMKFAPKRIVYISCHPATLARDAGILVNEYGYKMKKAGVMDMFPHTAHVESIAVFDKK